MAINCRNFGQNDPFAQRVIFLDSPQNTPNVKGEVAGKVLEVRYNTLRLDEQNREIVAKTMKYLEKVNKLDIDSLNKLNTSIKILDDYERRAAANPDRKIALEVEMESIFEDLNQSLGINKTDVEAIQLERKAADAILSAKEKHSLPYKIEYIKHNDGSTVNTDDLNGAFTDGAHFTVDYGGDKKAELKYGLHQMLPPFVTNLIVKTADNKVYTASKREDGKFRRDDNDKYMAVYQGYKFEIGTGKKTEKAIQPVAPAQPEKIDAHQAVEEEKTNAKITAFTQVAEDFNNNKKVVIPSELKNSKAWEYSEDMQYMNHGAEVKAALSNLNKIAGEKTWVDLWEKIRSRNLAKEDITLQEISKTVLGESSKDVYAKYNKLSVQNTILDLAEQGKKGGMEGTKLFKFIQSQLETDEEKITLNGMTEYLPGGSKDPKELRDQMKNLTDFMSAASTLMKEIPNLKPTAEAKEYKNENLISVDGLKEVETVASFVFPDKGDTGPEATRTWLQKVFKKGKHNLDMGTAYERGQINNDLQLSISGESAYVQLVGSALEYNEQGNLTVNLNAFVKKLNELRKLGVEHIGESQNKDLIQKWEQNKEFMSKPLEVKDISPQNNVVELERDLIRFGLRVDLNIKKTLDRYEILFDGVNDPITKQTMQNILTSGYDLDAREFKEVSENIKQQLLAYAKVGLESHKTVDNRHFTNKPGTSVENDLAFDVGKVFDAGHGIKWGVGLHGNVLSVTILKPEAFISATQKIGSRVKISEGVAASADTTGVKAGAAVSFEVALDKYAEHAVGIGAGAGINSNPYENLFVALGYNRSMEGTFERKKAEIGNDAYIMAILKEDLKNYSEQIKNFPPELRAQLLAEAAKFIESNRGSEAVKDMPKAAVTGAGLAYIPFANIFVPYIKVAFKGKDQIIYNIPKSMDKNALAEKRIKEALEAEVGNGDLKQVFVAGNMELTPDGYKTITEAEVKKDKLRAMNEALAKQGLQLWETTSPEGPRYRLKVNKSHGNVDIYTDSNSGIQVYPGEKGEVLVNLDMTDVLSIKRVDELNSLRDSGGVYNTKIYISNDAGIGMSDVEYRSPQILHFKSGLTEGQKTQAVLVENKAGKGAAFASEKATLEAGYKVGDLYKNMEELRSAGTGMSEALKSEKYGETLSQDRKTALDALAQKLLDDPKSKLDYKKLSVEMDEKAVIELLKTNLPSEQLPKTNREKTYLRQTLMVKSLAKAPQDKAFIEHIRKWNEQALERQLKAKNMDKTMAHEIASKIMTYYADQLDKHINEGGALDRKYISQGSIVQIQVGTQGVEGYRETFYLGNGNPELIGVQNLTDPESLQKYGLSPEQAKAFIDAVTNRLSPLSEKPEELIRSQLGLSVLSGAEIIFGAEKCKLLTEIVKDPSLASDEKHNETYKEFRDLVFKLRQDGKAEVNGMTLNVATEKSMGFYDACRNFTLVMNEKLSIGIPETKVVGTQVRQYIEGQRAANYKEYGIAFSFKRSETLKKPQEHNPKGPPEQPEEEETPEAGKIDLGDVGLGKPTHGENQGADINDGPV